MKLCKQNFKLFHHTFELENADEFTTSFIFPFRIDLNSESDASCPQISDAEIIVDLKNQLRMANESIVTLQLNCQMEKRSSST